MTRVYHQSEKTRQIVQNAERQHKQFLERARARKAAGSAGSVLNPGVYTKTFTGLPTKVGAMLADFHKRMQAAYYDYAVINVSNATTPSGVCAYLTFSVGNHR